ncbi:PepSY domain-containing protein [Paracoccus sediminicola]|uniref:PepSY domain-containing protein n=1 Tax=Paracoccus sediminicola TaxID=3017783 RepID=UPI0022EFEBB6|nr:hypothetical protein [Paracoccus sediminicola]WBU57753.1 hypothetical protein PAF18_04770 [Paracoccus sediminicola]
MLRIVLTWLALSLPLAAEPPRQPLPLPLHDVVTIIAARYEGRLLAARLDPPDPFEYALGTDLVHELTLISPQRNVIRIRLDAMTGRVLDVRGRGLIAARVPPQTRKER